MAYNPGVQRLDPMEAAGALEQRRQFNSELPQKQMQAGAYSRQVDIMGKEQEDKRKEMLRALKEDNDKQRGLAVAYGLPKEVAESSSLGELKGFNEKQALDHVEKARQFRDEDAKARDREQAAMDKARREGLEKVGTVTEANGVKVLRTGPETVQAVQPPRTARTLDNAPSAQLLSLRNGATKNAMGMMMSYDELSEEQKALVDNIDAILADRGETVRVQPDAAGVGAVAGEAAGAAATPNPAAAAGKLKATGLDRWKVSK
jgi:hypothetical protein